MHIPQPHSPGGQRRERVILTVTVVMLCLLLYRLTAPTDLPSHPNAGDGPELALAAYYRGVAHPPGYALYVLVGGFVTRLPLSTGVYDRLVLLNHVLAVSTALLVMLTVWRMYPPANMAGAAAAGLVFALNSAVWSQALIVEVYLLLIVHFAALLLLSTVPRGPTTAFAAGALLTSAVIYHLSALIWLPGWLLIFARQPKRALLLGALAGCMPLLLLVAFASSAPPFANWGAAQTSFTAFWAHISAAQYHGYWQTPTLEAWLTHVLSWLGDWTRSLTPPLAVAVIAGWLLHLWQRREWSLAAASVYWVAATVSLTAGYQAEQTTTAYTLVLYVLAALWVGRLIAVLPGRWGWAAVLLITVTLTTSGYARVNLRVQPDLRPWLHTALTTLPEGTVVLTDLDRQTFPLWYAQHIEGQRPDLAIIDRRLLRLDWYTAQLRATYPRIPADQPVAAWVDAQQRAGRPVASSSLLPPAAETVTLRRGDWYLSQAATPTPETD